MTTPNIITITADPATWSRALWAIRLHANRLPYDSGAIEVVATLDDLRAWMESLTPNA